MSPGPFPERVDISKLFARHGHIAAVVPLVRFTRLAATLATTDGEVVVDLQFGVDTEGTKQLSGSISGKLQLVCQRCLGMLDFSVSRQLAMLVFDTQEYLEKYQQLHGYGHDNMDVDMIVLEEMGLEAIAQADQPSRQTDEVDLLVLVEDELLLSLPLAPLHEDVACNKELLFHQQQSEAVEREVQATVVKPFAALAQLKKPH